MAEQNQRLEKAKETDPNKIFSEFSTEGEFTFEEKELIDSSIAAIKRSV